MVKSNHQRQTEITVFVFNKHTSFNKGLVYVIATITDSFLGGAYSKGRGFTGGITVTVVGPSVAMLPKFRLV